MTYVYLNQSNLQISPCHIFFGFHRTPPLDHYPTWCHVMPSLQHHGPCPTSVTDQVDHCPPRNVATSSPVDLEASLVFHHEGGEDVIPWWCFLPEMQKKKDGHAEWLIYRNRSQDCQVWTGTWFLTSICQEPVICSFECSNYSNNRHHPPTLM